MPWKPDKLRFGCSGIPTATKPRNTINGIAMARRCGLEAMELEFVHGVNLSAEKAKLVKRAAEYNNIILTAHGQYHINLSSRDPAIRLTSIQRVLIAARRAFECGAWSMTFHAGYYGQRSSAEASRHIHKALEKIGTILDEEGTPIWIRPEAAGRLNQWGDVAELIAACRTSKRILPCIDFSHLHARSFGSINSYEKFRMVLAQLEDGLGRSILSRMHMHAQGIEFGKGGEKRHLLLEDSMFDYRGLMQALKEFNAKGILICESPRPEKDAQTLQMEYQMHAEA